MAPQTVASQNYYNEHIAPAKNMNLPSQIMCSRCDYIKGPDSFSSVKQNELLVYMRKNPRFDAKKTTYVPCVNCTGGQKVEMKCDLCDKWKGKDAYNKSQWREDDGTCEDCNRGDMRRGFEPTNPYDREDPDRDDTDDSGGAGSSSEDDETDLSRRMGGASLASRGGTSISNDSYDTRSVTSRSVVSSSYGGVSTRRGAPSSTAPTSAGSSKWAKVPAGESKTINKPREPEIGVDDLQVSGDSDSDSN